MPSSRSSLNRNIQSSVSGTGRLAEHIACALSPALATNWPIFGAAPGHARGAHFGLSAGASPCQISHNHAIRG
jgi:hypothetical protein